MKRIKQTITLCVFAVCIITGCSGAADKETEPVTTEEVAVTPEPTIDAELHEDNLMGIYIGEEKSQIGLGLSTDDTLDILGKADKTKKSGKKTIWYYKTLDVTITFQKTNGAKTITAIKGGKNASTLLTGAGIASGASREEVCSAYREQLGKDTDTSGSKIIIHNLDYSRLVLILEKDTVVSVCLELL